jgi:hypothetical protein
MTSPTLARDAADAADASESDALRFTLHRDCRSCPRCKASTWGQQTCPVCRLVLDDATLADARTEAETQARRQRLALAAIALVTITALGTGALGYRLGARSVPVAAYADSSITAAAQQRYWNNLPRATQFQLHATQLQLLFRPEMLHVVGLNFKPVAIPGQAPVAGTPDLTMVVSSDSGWLSMATDERRVALAALAKMHQSFLGFSSFQDTTHFAVALKLRAAGGQEQVLGLRDRNGILRVR